MGHEDSANSGKIRGTYVTTIDGVDYYSDGIKHNTTTISARIAYIDFSRTYDQISDESAWEVGASTQFPLVNIDNEGNVRVGYNRGPFEAGVVRFSDGTTGVYGNINIGNKFLGLSYGVTAGGEASGAFGSLSTYNHIEVFSDGSYAKVEYELASGNTTDNISVTGAKVRRTEYNVDGTIRKTYVGSVTSKLAQEMAAGLATHIYDESSYWGARCFPASAPIAVSATESRPISDIRVGDTVLAFDPSAEPVDQFEHLLA